jgi:hypothetical protein
MLRSCTAAPRAKPLSLARTGALRRRPPRPRPPVRGPILARFKLLLPRGTGRVLLRRRIQVAFLAGTLGCGVELCAPSHDSDHASEAQAPSPQAGPPAGPGPACPFKLPVTWTLRRLTRRPAMAPHTVAGSVTVSRTRRLSAGDQALRD